MTRALALFLLVACGSNEPIRASAPRVLAAPTLLTPDPAPKERRRMVPPEAYLRSYLKWFGGLSPRAVENAARGADLFDSWVAYASALGLPDHRLDIPRATQSNALMRASLGRVGEALCVRAIEHDLRQTIPVEARLIFKFDVGTEVTKQGFAVGFDVLHKTFLGYPLALADPERLGSFFALFESVAARHERAAPLSSSQTAWAAVCLALIQHPEAELY